MNIEPPFYHFWNPFSGPVGGLIMGFVVVLILFITFKVLGVSP